LPDPEDGDQGVVGLLAGLQPDRLKRYPLLTKPRRLAQEEVRQNGHPKKQR
jgi:hypothetical protein